MAQNNKQKRNVNHSGFFEDVKESIEEGVDKGAQAVVDFVRDNTGLLGDAEDETATGKRKKSVEKDTEDRGKDRTFGRDDKRRRR